MAHALAAPPLGSDLRPVMGSAGIPYVGRSMQYIRDPLALWRQQERRYGQVSWHTMAGRRVVLVLGADGCEEILTNRDKAFSNALGWRPLIGPFFDNGLMLMDLGEHRHHRRLLQQAFTKDRLASYAAAMEPLIARTVQEWDSSEHFEIYPAVKSLTLGLATEVFMGGVRDGDTRLDAVNKAFVDCVQAATSIVRLDVPGGRWRRGLKGRRFLEDFLRDYLPDRRRGDGRDLFSVLAHLEDDDGERFSDDAIIDHMIFLLMAAHDTSTITISTMVDQLGRHPQWQEECRRQSLAAGPDVSAPEARAGLTALDAVMKESLRMLAPLPTMARWTVRDTVIRGHHVPADVMVVATPHYTHHDPTYWSDPEVFDPTRFDGRALPHKFAWQPFGGGVHTCLGQFFSAIEITMVLHHLLRHHTWSVPADRATPIDFTSLPYPKDGQPVRLQRRS
ncbi:cytochrome P450 [Rhodococcus sp. BP-149]|uniref:cytochrome P450 n=1 Tax=unclassified Rhodococcus (in: high G+C Gram-positive bacteria) TaxID=192944 RepID=UPI001C9B909E|nr:MULTISPECIES: cytochrome P450 [unclassified Rhodococcus (in: high G+C Gram-positive bacteria)]MBY6685057.1 cytochrome P450 [Rhodococcus sp. BP-288]MBY6692459.1 cytochrome P450 [Rhodococcus sp. BP-188]MBY6698357.1 cytochrome P450 [Rhodococcus sp. BP-285]MBY6701036.1 cytochrome P450 [Rhodococcus sp. BP-283]MBY6705957.1 cytochrome P450 [Rhodococcus sp. BP-241]